MGDEARRIVWGANAHVMLDDVLAFVTRESSPTAADKLLEQVLDAADSLATLSERGRVVSNIGRLDVREIFVGRFRMMYRVFEKYVEIVAFLHGARELR